MGKQFATSAGCILVVIVVLQLLLFSRYHRQIDEVNHELTIETDKDERVEKLLGELEKMREMVFSEREKVRELQSQQALNPFNTQNTQILYTQQSRIEQLQELQHPEVLHVTGSDEKSPKSNIVQGGPQQKGGKVPPNTPKTWPIRDPQGSLGTPLGPWNREIFEFPAGNEEIGCVATDAETGGVVAAVVIVAFNRPQYLKQMLEYLFEAYNLNPANKDRFPIYISQDGTDAAVKDMAKSFRTRNVRYMQHVELKNVTTEGQKENAAYYRIANHYKYIMQQFFACFKYPKLLILEDDMQLSVDFFEYFAETSQLLDSDPSLYCISSWNDHGQEKFVRDPSALYRSDFFPGLGWMLARELGLELLQGWPKSYWDDWMRLSDVRKGRQCIRPEICRNYNFGEKGTSKGFYYRKFIKPIKLNTVKVDWSGQDLSYLHQDQYEQHFMALVTNAKQVKNADIAKTSTGDVRLEFNSQEQYEAHTLALGMLREWKDGVPRGAYNGIVSVRYEDARIFLAPGPDFQATAQVPEGVRVVVDQTGAVVRKKSPTVRKLVS
eukprot:TRINITY_DN7582_c0_g1_i3.p1 TRINITY_DN7582_c0_g1~~TRINITY_DN7582_c0_g1_i3.p1  ORF type:complete len:551 (+),score=89.84 TRINITY_DN7582_c0_g1_i3:831-2483(+)